MYKSGATIFLEMHLDGRVVDAVSVSGFSLRTRYYDYLNDLKAELREKHQSLLSTAGSHPAFFLCGVQSCINSFVPLTRFEGSG